MTSLKAGLSAPLAVRNELGGLIAELVPFTPGLADEADLLQAMCSWRAIARDKFLSVFEPTPETTRSYLINISLPSPSRILFLIRGVDGRPLGNIGLCNIDSCEAELDNVLRGEIAPHRMMHFVQLELLRFCFDQLRLPMVYLNVISDNDRAIAAYERIGFSSHSLKGLRKEEISGGYRLVAVDGPGDAGRPGLMRMELRAAQFRELHFRENS